MIKSIQKELQESSTISLGKLRLDFSKEPRKNIQKAITYIMKQTEEVDILLLKKVIILLLNHKPTSVIELKKSPSDLNLHLGGGRKGLDYTNYYEYRAVSEKGNEVEYYFDMNGNLPQSKNGTSWIRRNDNSKFYVFNGKRLLAVNELFNRLQDVKPSLIEHKNYLVQQYFHKGYEFFHNTLTDQEILDALIIAFEKDNNIELMKKYEASQASDYAKAFMTKKNISEVVADKMKSTDFLKHGFKFVEFDNETDLAKLSTIEQEWKNVYYKLPTFTQKPDLRFRKLGQHRASGLYYPLENCVCVDIRNIQSLIHEVGHLLDYTMSNTTLSLTEEFRPIIHSYRERVALLEKDNYVQKKSSYYLTPTEVFARAFEIYQLGILETSFLKSEDAYNNLEEYTCFDNNNRLEIEKYFSKILPNIQ